jgi:hypothetical protein
LKSTKLRSTSITLVSTLASPASTHSDRSVFMRETSALGGYGAGSPIARSSTCSACAGNPPPNRSHT